MKKTALIYLFFYFIFACVPSQEPIQFGEDQCSYCRMLLVDQRYGAELVTKNGKIYKFDAIECLAAFYLSKKIENNQKHIHSMWTIDFERPKKLIKLQQAVILESVNLKSPMGLNLTSFNSEQTALMSKEKYSGKILSWEQVLQLVRKKWKHNDFATY